MRFSVHPFAATMLVYCLDGLKMKRCKTSNQHNMVWFHSEDILKLVQGSLLSRTISAFRRGGGHVRTVDWHDVKVDELCKQ